MIRILAKTFNPKIKINIVLKQNRFSYRNLFNNYPKIREQNH